MRTSTSTDYRPHSNALVVGLGVACIGVAVYNTANGHLIEKNVQNAFPMAISAFSNLASTLAKNYMSIGIGTLGFSTALDGLSPSEKTAKTLVISSVASTLVCLATNSLKTL